MGETRLRTKLSPVFLTRSSSVEVPATRKLRTCLHSFLYFSSKKQGGATSSPDCPAVKNYRTLTFSVIFRVLRRIGKVVNSLCLTC